MYAIISDIHGNMYAFQAVVEDMKHYNVQGCILLGDLIDYGMQSNEVISYLSNSLEFMIVCNIWGNHEKAIIENDYSRFSSLRGTISAKYTASVLNEQSRVFLNTKMQQEGLCEFVLKGKKCLAVHGSLEDHYWNAVFPDNEKGDYKKYEIVFSGHSHIPHLFSRLYCADDPYRRNKKSVLFINPGSVGQPRNHNPNAQYALIDINQLSVIFRTVPYDVNKAMSLYDGSVDDFYRIRLKTGV